jgi:hypothetical protein
MADFGRDGMPRATATMRFAPFPFSPTGAYLDKVGSQFAYLDLDGDETFSKDSEPAGKCDVDRHRCSFPEVRLTLTHILELEREPGGAGVFEKVSGIRASASAFAADGTRMEGSVCYADGTCAPPGEPLYQCDGGEPAATHRYMVKHPRGEQRFDQLATPPAFTLRHVDVSERTDSSHVEVEATDTIDLAVLTLRRGDETVWTSAQSSPLRASGNRVSGALPRSAVAACGAECEAVLQVAHLWRDDGISHTSEIQLNLW